MAEHEPPENGVRKVFEDFNERMKEHLANLDDFAAAIDAVVDRSGTPDEIIDDWEARQLLRHMPPDAPTQ